MDPHRFRPELWEVEDRVTPSTTPAAVFAGLAAVPADAAVLRYAAEPGVLVAAAGQPLGRATLSLIEARSVAAAQSLGDFLGSLGNTLAANPGLTEFLTPYVEQAAGAFFQANANAAVARAFGQVVDRLASGAGLASAGTLTGATGATGTTGTTTTGTTTTGTTTAGTTTAGTGTGTATTLGGSTPTGTTTTTLTPNAGTTGTTTGVSGNPGTSASPTGTSGTTTGTATGGTPGTDPTTTNTTTSGTSAGTTGGTM